MQRAGVVRFAGTSLAVTSPLSAGIALPARVVPTGAPTAGLGRGALSGGGTRGVPGRQGNRTGTSPHSGRDSLPQTAIRVIQLPNLG